MNGAYDIPRSLQQAALLARRAANLCLVTEPSTGLDTATDDLVTVSDRLADLGADPLMGSRLHQRIVDLRIDLDSNLRAAAVFKDLDLSRHRVATLLRSARNLAGQLEALSRSLIALPDPLDQNRPHRHRRALVV